MVRSIVKTRNGPCVGIYLKMVREYMASFLLPVMEKEKAGGSYNQTGIFLATTSQETVVTSKSGVNRRSVMLIPLGQCLKGLAI